MALPKCPVEGCYRSVPTGQLFCSVHAEGKEGNGPWAEAVRRGLLDGDVPGMIGPRLTSVLTDAASEPPLINEIGALRVMMIRMLLEDGDLGRIATTVARLASVAVQAARAQYAIRDSDEAKFDAWVQRLMDGEPEAADAKEVKT